jgi:hypothetical protein
MTDDNYLTELKALLDRSNTCIDSLLETIKGWQAIHTLDEQYIAKLERDLDLVKAQAGKLKLLKDLQATEAELWAAKDAHSSH